MNEATFKKYIIKIADRGCDSCRRTGTRNHFARMILTDLGIGSFDAPCYNCRQEEFRAFVLSNFAGQNYHRILAHYQPH